MGDEDDLSDKPFTGKHLFDILEKMGFQEQVEYL